MIWILESGVAADGIDDAMVLGCSHPMGPLRFADRIGVDTEAAIVEVVHRAYREPRYALLLRRMVDAGLLGRKTAKGSTCTTGTAQSPIPQGCRGG